nr:MAG TPA: hypothetical protein [Caudoviricetes sp.]
MSGGRLPAECGIAALAAVNHHTFRRGKAGLHPSVRTDNRY